MKTSDLCEKIEYRLLQGSMDTEVTDVIYDSRKVTEGTMFVCLVGAVTDGHKYIPDALAQGAKVIVAEREEACKDVPAGITVILVKSARHALAYISAAYFDYPADKLTTIGLTGTKGKTTTTYIIQDVLRQAGRKAGLIGTIATVIGDTSVPAKNTTPESYEIHKSMAAMVDAGCELVVMEVSSQGLKFDRTAGIRFDYGIFTNLSEDHIGPNEHPDFADYLECKSRLFRQCNVGIINIDDPYAEQILRGSDCDILSFSAEKKADLRASDICFLNEDGKLGMHFSASGMMNCEAKIHIPGRFSVYNALATMEVCHELGVNDDAVLAGLEDVQVRGRVEMLPVSKKFNLIIDYAHNDVSTRSVLKTLREYDPGRIVAVFGCGGNRSKVRRYDIGEAAGELADLCILTSDNPRFEKVEDINNDIKVGLAKHNAKYIEIVDRREAIAYAITHALPADMIVLLGKGHETYIEIAGVRHHFSEREVVREIVEDIHAGRRKMEHMTL